MQGRRHAALSCRNPSAGARHLVRIRTTGCLPQVFRAKLRGKEEVAVKIFQLSARVKSEVRPCDHTDPVMPQQRHLMRMHFWYLLESLLMRISRRSLLVAPKQASGARRWLNTPDATLCFGAQCCEVCMPSPYMMTGRVQAGDQAAAGVRGRASCLIPWRVPRRAWPPAHDYRGRKDVASHCISQQPQKLLLRCCCALLTDPLPPHPAVAAPQHTFRQHLSLPSVDMQIDGPSGHVILYFCAGSSRSLTSDKHADKHLGCHQIPGADAFS